MTNYNRFSIILFLVFSSLILFWSFLIPTMYEAYERNAWFYATLGLAFSIILVLVGKNQSIKESYSRYFSGLYFLLSGIFIISLATDVLSNYIFLCSKWKILLPLVITILYLDYNEARTIFSVSTIFFIFGVVFLLFPFFVDSSSGDYDLIKPFSLNNSQVFLITLIIPLDFLSINYFKETKSSTIIIALIICFFFAILYMIESISLFGAPYLQKLNYSGYMIFENKGTGKFFGQFDFLYLYLIPVSTVFSVSFRFNMFRHIFKIKGKYNSFIGIAVLISTLFSVQYLIYSWVLLIPMILGRFYGLFKKKVS